MNDQSWKAELRPTNINVTASQADLKQAIRESNAQVILENVLLVNVGLKRTVKSLRKKLQKARLSFNRIMAETREAPDWYYESEVDSLSEGALNRRACDNIEQRNMDNKASVKDF